MNVQTVISKGQDIQIPADQFGSNTLLWLGCILLAIVVLAFGGNIIKSRAQNPRTLKIYLATTMLALFGFIIFNEWNGIQHKKQYKTDMVEWKETVAYPYIKSQPYTDRELVSIDREPVQYTTGIKHHHVVKYRDDSFITDTLLLPGGASETPDILYDLPVGETPFVRFYELDEDLGHGIDAGTYGLTVHLNQKSEK